MIDWKNEEHVQVVFRTGGNQSSPRFQVIKRRRNPSLGTAHPLNTTVTQFEATPPQPADLHQVLLSSRANICTPCLWEEWRPEHDVLTSLPWLPTCFRIDLKVLLLVFKCLNGFRSSFLSDLLLLCQPSQMLRSSGSGLWFSPQLELELWVKLHSACLTHVIATSGLLRPFMCAKYNFSR